MPRDISIYFCEPLIEKKEILSSPNKCLKWRNYGNKEVIYSVTCVVACIYYLKCIQIKNNSCGP